jgi:hypothetical protein
MWGRKKLFYFIGVIVGSLRALPVEEIHHFDFPQLPNYTWQRGGS